MVGMSASSTLAVKAGLLALIQARANLAAVQVTWAHPGKDQARESIFLNDPESPQQEVDDLRPTPRHQWEDYILPISVDVLAEGNDAQACETRGWALVNEVAAAVTNDTTDLGGAISAGGWAFVAGTPSMGYFTDTGRAWHCHVRVAIKARL